MIFQLFENLYLRWKEYRDRPKDLFWPHEHLNWIKKNDERMGN